MNNRFQEPVAIVYKTEQSPSVIIHTSGIVADYGSFYTVQIHGNGLQVIKK